MECSIIDGDHTSDPRYCTYCTVLYILYMNRSLNITVDSLFPHRVQNTFSMLITLSPNHRVYAPHTGAACVSCVVTIDLWTSSATTERRRWAAPWPVSPSPASPPPRARSAPPTDVSTYPHFTLYPYCCRQFCNYSVAPYIIVYIFCVFVYM